MVHLRDWVDYPLIMISNTVGSPAAPSQFILALFHIKTHKCGLIIEIQLWTIMQDMFEKNISKHWSYDQWILWV